MLEKSRCWPCVRTPLTVVGPKLLRPGDVVVVDSGMACFRYGVVVSDGDETATDVLEEARRARPSLRDPDRCRGLRLRNVIETALTSCFLTLPESWTHNRGMEGRAGTRWRTSSVSLGPPTLEPYGSAGRSRQQARGPSTGPSRDPTRQRLRA